MTRTDFELICAPVTPFSPDGSLDETSTARAFAFLRGAGIRKVLTPGTTGEFTTLSDAERARIVELALDVFGPEGVIAHIGAADARHAMSLAHDALLAGAEQFSAITPFFFPAGQTALIDYYQALRGCVDDRRLLAYAFPQRTGVSFPPETLSRLAKDHLVDGVKLSGIATADLPPYLHAAPHGFRVYSGNDIDTFELAEMGAHGVVSGVSSVFPEPFVAALNAVNGSGHTDSLPDQLRAAVIASAHGELRVLKLAGEARSVMSSHVRAALNPVTQNQQNTLDDYLASSVIH